MQKAPPPSAQSSQGHVKSARTHVRWWFCLLAFVATMIIYSDRQFLSLLKPTLANEIHWTDSQFGFVSSCFLGAYALGLIAFGWFIDRVGVRIGYATSLVLWSIVEAAHAMLGSVNGFVAGRIFLGITEGGNFPAAVKVIAQWFPKSERALATALFNSGAKGGAVGAPFFIAWLLEHGTWRSPFYIAGAAGIVWVVVWLFFYVHPRESRAVSPAELAWIEGDQTAEEAASTERIPWLRLLTLRQTWSFVVAKFMTDPVWFFLLIWLPDYFKKTRDLDIKHSWPLLVTVYSIVTVLSIAGGWVTGYLVRIGWSVTRARKTGMFCFALLVVPILAVGALGNWPAVCLLGLAGAAHQAWSANLMTTVSDMFPKRDVGSVIGLGSTGGALGSMTFIYLCGVIVQGYGDNSAAGYHVLFIYCACAYLIAFVLNHLLAPRFEPIHVKASE